MSVRGLRQLSCFVFRPVLHAGNRRTSAEGEEPHVSTRTPMPADLWLRAILGDRTWLDRTIKAALNQCNQEQAQPPSPCHFGIAVERAVQLDLCRMVPNLRDLHGFTPQPLWQ